MKALCKWVHLMIQLNMIKKNKATHIHMLPLSLPVGPFLMHKPAHTYTHSEVPRAFHIIQFHASSCGDLCSCVVILTRPTAHTESHNLLQTKCPQYESRTQTTPTEKHPQAFWAANPLWRNTQIQTNRDECKVIMCKFTHLLYSCIYEFIICFIFYSFSYTMSLVLNGYGCRLSASK